MARSRLVSHYILKDKCPVPVTNILDWARFLEDRDACVVASTQVGDARVSTVFTGLDLSLGHGPPLVFETMIFGGPLNLKASRCSTWDQAVEHHKAAVKAAWDASPSIEGQIEEIAARKEIPDGK